jgi:hypothetical protein
MFELVSVMLNSAAIGLLTSRPIHDGNKRSAAE